MLKQVKALSLYKEVSITPPTIDQTTWTCAPIGTERNLEVLVQYIAIYGAEPAEKSPVLQQWRGRVWITSRYLFSSYNSVLHLFYPAVVLNGLAGSGISFSMEQVRVRVKFLLC